MQEDFHERWGDSLHYSTNVRRAHRRRQKGIPTYSFWALALDPRTKRKVSKLLQEEEVVSLWQDIHDAIKRLLARETRTIEPLEQEQQQEVGQQRKKKRPAFLARADEDIDTATDSTPTIDQVLQAEIIAYKADKGQSMFNKDDGYNNPLDWWRIYADKYPNIWKLASCILAIPATSAPSERVFSAAANIINKKRVRLKPETLDLLIFLRGNKDFVQWD